MSAIPIVGGTASDVLSAPTGDGRDYKYEGKGGDDIIRGSTGNDLILGHQGSDLLFGGAGNDTFVFNKFASSNDRDIILDLDITKDTLAIGNGASIIGLEYGFFGETSLNGVGLANDGKVMDAKLTLQIIDGDKVFQQEVVVLDVIKNSGWSLEQFVDYLHYEGPVTHFVDSIA